MNDLPRYLTVLGLWAVLAVVMVAAMSGCGGGSYTRSGDWSFSFGQDAQGTSTGFELFNPLRDFVDDRNLPSGMGRFPGFSPVDEPITYEQPKLRDDAIIEWSDSLGCWVAR